MTQPIAAAHPDDLREAAVMTVWPSIAAYPLGRWLGRLYDIKWPDVHIARLGNGLALLSIPLAIAIYCYRLLPSFFGAPFCGCRYLLTNRRVAVLRSEVRWRMTRFLGVPVPTAAFQHAVEARSVPLDGFDTIALDLGRGQQWFDAADLAFLQDGREKLRLEGVSRPAAFRQACLKSRQAYVGVRKALQQETS